MATNSQAESNSGKDLGVEIHDPTALQKHVMFFDINKDGIIYPWETFQGFRAIGSGILLSAFASIFINVGLSRKTRPGKGFSLLFPVEIKNIKKSKHGSDSGVYDKEGRFVPEKFDEIFGKHASTNKNSLTSDELSQMLKANREPKDYRGWIAAYSEWKILYILCKDKHGLLHKETIRAVYDGSLFEQMAKEKASNKKPKFHHSEQFLYLYLNQVKEGDAYYKDKVRRKLQSQMQKFLSTAGRSTLRLSPTTRVERARKQRVPLSRGPFVIRP